MSPYSIHVSASVVAAFLQARLVGPDVPISRLADSSQAREGTLSFSKKPLNEDWVSQIQGACFLVNRAPEDPGLNAFIPVEDPRLAFARAAQRFMKQPETPDVGQGSVIHPTARIGEGASIGCHCYIGPDAVIGESTIIRHHVTIDAGVVLGAHCLVKSGTVIGEEGFGFAFDANQTPVRLPHVGSVLIGDHVELGALNTVARGTLKDTIVQSHVKTDDHVHIAHNCQVGQKTVITACAELSGGVRVGEKSWLGPNCSIMNQATLGDGCTVGLGAVVLADAPDGAVLAGNPARILRIRKTALR